MRQYRSLTGNKKLGQVCSVLCRGNADVYRAACKESRIYPAEHHVAGLQLCASVTIGTIEQHNTAYTKPHLLQMSNRTNGMHMMNQKLSLCVNPEAPARNMFPGHLRTDTRHLQLTHLAEALTAVCWQISA